MKLICELLLGCCFLCELFLLGPLYYKGYYHLFYQYDPYAAVWGNIVWGHAVSTDMIHWRYLEEALVGSEWYDIYGCWSGSATLLDDGTPVILYTGWSNASAVIQSQTQNMAFPANASDPLLLKWVKVCPWRLAPFLLSYLTFEALLWLCCKIDMVVVALHIFWN